MSDLLAEFPYELVLEVSHYLCYSDIQSFRLTCRRISKIVEHLALANLTLDLDKVNQDNFLDFPLAKYKAYTEPDGTRGSQHVRHFMIYGLCVNFSASRCSYEQETGCDEILLRLTRPHEHKEVVYRRIKLFFEVIDKLFVSPAFARLQSIRWEIPPCKMHEMRWEGECSKTVHQLMPLLLRERDTPLHRLEFVALELGYLPKFPTLPLCKELYVRGMPEFRSNTAQTTAIATWLEETITFSPHLQVVDWDLLLNKGFIERLILPRRDGALGQKMEHKTLMLAHGGGRLKERFISPFRNISTLHLYCDEPKLHHISSLLCESSLAPLWLQLVEEQIFVEELRVYLNQMGDAFIDYLTSYPSPCLKNLRLRCLGWDVDYASLDVTPQRFYKRAMPVIAPGLEDFTMKTNEINNWCFGVLPESYAAYNKCSALSNLSIMMQASDTLEHTVRKTFSGLPLLRAVDVRIPVERTQNDRSPPTSIHQQVDLQ